MPEAGYLAVFLVGLLGGVHCMGMCGGVVTALTSPLEKERSGWGRQIAYNLGRIASYTLLGAMTGAIGSATLLFNHFLPIQLGLYLVANLMLVGMGLYLMGFTRSLVWLESLGQHLWRRVQRLGAAFLPVRNWRQALPAGFLWGFLPCGMTYSVLSLALVSGSAWRGAGLMLAFGAGTLPNLLLAGMLLVRCRTITRHRLVRLTAGLLVLGFGLYGLYRAPALGGALWEGVICAPDA